jgi:bifunctional DNA-binding transcriptional regulator/antitoxin component of YhaV-PrlF toxin-antitoxin module
MEIEKPLVNQKYLLEKYPGKGGWTYAAIPEILQDKHAPFGWVEVKGFIDALEIKKYKLMPMGNGQLFLPVKAEIRKKIGKKEGDWVHVILYADNSPIEIPEEFLICLKEDLDVYNTFMTYTDGQKKEFIDWIYATKTDEKKVERIAIALNKLERNEKLRELKR